MIVADYWFSIYIRLRDANSNGIVMCITCGKPYFWKGGILHCGHYQKRRKLNTRYDERNCAGQCLSCNYYKSGRDDIFALEIDRKWGEGTAEHLRRIANQHGKKTKLDFELWAEEYREKAHLMARKKCLEI